MELKSSKIKILEYLFYITSLVLFLFFFNHTLDYERTYDDYLLLDLFTRSPGDAKLFASYLYAKFHFYPIYFLSHELDNFITFLFLFNDIEIQNSKIAKFTNIFLHVTNSFLTFFFLKKIFKIKNNFKDNILLYLSSLIFLFHPITSQIIFNITTRNESLALFFGLLTFIYCLDNSYNKKIINYFIISLLFFFSLCSKVTTIFLFGLIPLTIFLLNFHTIDIKENFKRNFDTFITLGVTFIVYYYLRSEFTEKNDIEFFSKFSDLAFYFLTTLKFYLIGLFFPTEHIYVYATNYDFGLSVFIFILFLIFAFFSIIQFIKKKDPILLIGFFWICASLSLPVLLGLIYDGFPLISNLAERYQYSSVVSISIILSWIFIKFFNTTYKKTFILSSYFLILFFSIFILFDRSKVYVNNVTFMNQIDENSPRNVHRYAFTVDLNQASINNDRKTYIYNLYQWYPLNTTFHEVILEFLRFYIFEKNDSGIRFFENEYLKYHKYNPTKKFTLARFYTSQDEYEKAENQLLEIFQVYDDVQKKALKENQTITFINPAVDDLYFELGKIYFNQEKYEKALENFKTANVINPLHATALYNGAITLKKMGLNNEAAELYKEAIKINPFLRETANNMIAGAQNNEK